jgi:RND family efflux transporter MFP subunit
LGYGAFFLSLIVIVSCGGKKEDTAASMEQLHAENGLPVSIRQLETEDFSVFLKYPALISASSESTAYAALDDVVRTVSARVGQTVRQGDIIVSFSADNRALQQAILAHNNTRTAFNRSSFLFRNNDISRQDFEVVRMQYELSTTNLKAANDMVYVKAPISGTITQINIRETQNVRPGTPLFTVSNSSAFEAQLYVGMAEIDRIQVGARAFIDLDRGKQEGKRIEGRIVQVSLSMDSQKQSFPVTVTFNGENGPAIKLLASGMNVDVSVETYRNENAFILSRRELVQTETGPAVFIVENGGDPADAFVRLAAVQTGEESGLRVEITGGLNKGDIIVSDGVQRINADSRINIVPAIASSGL